MEHNIRIKNSEVLRQILNRQIHSELLEIVLWIAEEHGLCITEAWRIPKRKGDVHATDPFRAVDLRSWFYRKPGLAKRIEKEINELWEYDYKRPEKNCAWIHDSGEGIHFHIQVHPNTRRRI